MRMHVKRKWLSPVCTIGELFVDGELECFTLEDRYRPPPEPKVPRETAIPNGIYEIVVNYSNRFQQQMPLLLDVPHFQGVRIHTGNTHHHTEGCLLVGRKREGDRILESKLAYEALFPRIQAAVQQGKVHMTVEIVLE